MNELSSELELASGGSWDKKKLSLVNFLSLGKQDIEYVALRWFPNEEDYQERMNIIGIYERGRNPGTRR